MKKKTYFHLPFFALLVLLTGSAFAQTATTVHFSVSQAPCATAVQQEESALSVTVFPNPARNDFRVTLESPANIGKVECSLWNVLGEQVIYNTMQVSARKLTVPFDVRGLAPGTYFLRITTGSASSTERIVLN
ncbi:MAG: hypothetical protein FD123_3224 [Bacteroidetes bacterium]|nr:MAG: hypothetical protein FD123_3224 [Bacteroidota bacterium]